MTTHLISTQLEEICKSDITFAICMHILDNTNYRALYKEDHCIILVNNHYEWLTIDTNTGDVTLSIQHTTKTYKLSDPAQSQQAFEELNNHLGINQK